MTSPADNDVEIDHAHWAAYLRAAADERCEVEAITARVGAFALTDAYAIQETLVRSRLDAGDTIAGAKLGLTSRAKQEQMGVTEPAYGWVLGSSLLGTDGRVKIDGLIHPRVEPEFVFLIAEALSGPDVTADDVLDATEWVVGGIEVIDSRYEQFRFTLPDVIADQTSAARALIGRDGVRPRDVDLNDVTCTFTVDGEITGEATGASLLGGPAACVAMLVHHLARSGRGLEPGWTVLAGAPTDARPLTKGTVATAHYSHFGDVTVVGV